MRIGAMPIALCFRPASAAIHAVGKRDVDSYGLVLPMQAEDAAHGPVIRPPNLDGRGFEVDFGEPNGVEDLPTEHGCLNLVKRHFGTSGIDRVRLRGIGGGMKS